MAAKTTKKTARAKSPKKRTLSPEVRAAYGEIKQGIGHLEKSIGEINRGLRAAERKIEADARARVREIRTQGRAQLAALKAKQRDAGSRGEEPDDRRRGVVAGDQAVGGRDPRRRARDGGVDHRSPADGDEPLSNGSGLLA